MVKTLAVLLQMSCVSGSVLYNPAMHVASPSTGCGKVSPYTKGKTTKVTGTYGGVEYIWRVYVPSSYKKNKPMPLVTQHHGWGMNSKAEETGSGISIYAEQYGYIAVYPQGSNDNPNRGGPWFSWNAVGTTQSPGPNQPTCTQSASNAQYCYDSCGQCSDSPQCWWTTCHDEVTPSGTGSSPVDGFVPSLYDTLESQLCIDTTREFAAGESNGGMMTYQLGVNMASRLAAVVAEFGSFHYQFAMSPKSSVSILAFHGTKDTTVPANVSLSGDGYYYTPVEEIFYGSQYSAGWRSANGCSGGDSHYPTSFDGQYSLYCVSTGQCTGGDVVRCAWNGGHNWYGNNPESNGGLVSEFLMKWAKPSHSGFGRVQGEAQVEAKIMQNIRIVPDSEEPSFELPVTVVPAAQGHYGDPKAGCLDDEEVVELADGKACMPIVGPAGDENGLPTPHCQIGGVGPQSGNGCPTDAPVSPGSKAFPLCVAKGNTTDPYRNGEFHCVLACPCTTLDQNGECSAESDSHCPQGATCRLGELRHRGQGVCTYTGEARSIIV